MTNPMYVGDELYVSDENGYVGDESYVLIQILGASGVGDRRW